MRWNNSFCKAAVLVILMMCITHSVAGYDFVSGNVYYELNNDNTTVTVTNDGVDYGCQSHWSPSARMPFMPVVPTQY